MTKKVRHLLGCSERGTQNVGDGHDTAGRRRRKTAKARDRPVEDCEWKSLGFVEASGGTGERD